MQMIILLIMEKEEIASQMHALLHIWQRHWDIKTSMSVQMQRGDAARGTVGQKSTDLCMILFFQKQKITANIMGQLTGLIY